MDFKSALKPPQKQEEEEVEEQQQQQPPPPIGLLPKIGLLLLTAIAISAVYKARRDPWTIAFVVPAYLNLMLLFWCFRAFENLTPQSPAEKKENLKLGIWVLATTLNLLFACRSSEIMPGFVAVTFWVLTVFVGVTGFLLLFIYRHPNINSTTSNPNLRSKNSNNKDRSNKVSSEEDRV